MVVLFIIAKIGNNLNDYQYANGLKTVVFYTMEYVCVYVHLVAKSFQTLYNSMDCSCEAPLSWISLGKNTELSFPPLGDFPYPGIQHISSVSPVLAGGFSPLSHLVAHTMECFSVIKRNELLIYATV